jgi:hypothetical protein
MGVVFEVKMRKIKTTGDLRKVLLESISDVQCGHLDVSKAQAIGKLAAQVTESLYAELKANKQLADLGEKTQKLNGLPLHGEISSDE